MPSIQILIQQEEIPFSEKNFITSLAGVKDSFGFYHNNCISSNAIFLEFQILEESHFPAQQVVGPKLSNEQAIEGFYKKYPHEMGFVISKTGNNYVARKEASTKTAEEIAPEIVEKYILEVSKSWKETLDLTINGNNLPWCRPIHSISAFIGESCSREMVSSIWDCYSEKVHSTPAMLNAKPIAHKFAFNSLEKIMLSDTPIAIGESPTHYKINEIEKELGITCVSRESVAELAHVYDIPQFQIAQIPSQYLSLPKELLRLTIAKNQRYILFEREGKIVPQFLIVGKKHSEEILKGHIKTLKARLEDAKYYINDDLKTFKTAEVSPSLEKIIFHEKYGSIAKRVEEMKALAEKLFPNDASLQKAIAVSKNDLTTQIVQSFTELQGYMGGFYLENLGLDAEISNAVSQHYRPLNPSDDLPNSTLGKQLSLVDKLQKINALAEIGEMPTSSRDPFAVRRDILSIIRIWDKLNPKKIYDIAHFQTFDELSHLIDKKLHGFLEERLKLYAKDFNN
jgi:glycyl-tRNA synthetase beta chain